MVIEEEEEEDEEEAEAAINVISTLFGWMDGNIARTGKVYV